ncbi:MAG TPA: choice-of-anchor tandem repeat GloVer-containing protein, partial [Candidatus Nitrosotenuis sp.]|nr:choice-of-anchor tandem repeat GloVer-containing protein [Candidatus Nitrosotenuis sp.]
SPGLSVLHSFRGSDGAWSRGSLLRVGDTLYGRTALGGAYGSGTIFRIGTDGTGFAVLHSFTAGADNGQGNQPHHNAMFLLDGRLYGACLYGGNNDNAPPAPPGKPGKPKDGGPPPTAQVGNGTLFALSPQGQGYAVVLPMRGGTDGSSHPHSPPTAVGATLYGMTSDGGAHGRGTLYSVAADGSGYRILHSFHPDTGSEPHGMVVTDSTGRALLGMTRKGGRPRTGQGAGVIFRYDLETGRYRVLHVFQKGVLTNGDTNDHGFLTRVGHVLYGTTQWGGAGLKGTLFSIGEDGKNFRILHSFQGGKGDGAEPYGSLTPLQGWLYGTTTRGGARNDGTLFRYNPATRKFQLLASFDRRTTGALPEDNVVADAQGRVLYGLTQTGGVHDPRGRLYYGTLFAFPVPRD